MVEVHLPRCEIVPKVKNLTLGAHPGMMSPKDHMTCGFDMEYTSSVERFSC